jgi:hypothetical protein
VDTCGHVLSCQAFNVTASREPGSIDTDPMLKARGRGSQEPRYVLSRRDEMGLADRW